MQNKKKCKTCCLSNVVSWATFKHTIATALGEVSANIYQLMYMYTSEQSVTNLAMHDF